MSAKVWQEIKEILGERATTDVFERQFYQRDLAPVPEFLVDPMAKTLPDIIVRPCNAAELSDVVKIAVKEKIPITGRAGGSTVYFNSVCSQNGILVDFNGLTGLGKIDRSTNRVRVGAGTTWAELERVLNRQGLAVCSYPSSAPSATVGGWLAMMGYGLGSLKYGALVEQVAAAQVVLPDGSIQELTHSTPIPVSWLAGSEGTLGLITEVELQIRPIPEIQWHGMAVFQDAAAMQHFIEQAAALEEKPFNLHFSDPGCNALRYRLGMGSEPTSAVYTAAFDADGTKDEIAEAAEGFSNCLSAAGGEDWSQEAAEEWEHRFFSLLLKREGPSLLGAELWLPINKLALYLRDISSYENKEKLGLKTYGHVVSSSHAMVMTMFNADERNTIGYLQGLALVKKLHDIGARYGAAPYGIGLWNTSYLQRNYTKTQLAELKQRKKQLDPNDLMNPGKLYQAPLFLSPPFFSIGMDILAASRLFYRGRNLI